MKQQPSNKLAAASNYKLLPLSLAGALIILLVNRVNAQVTYVGEQDNIQGWRSTSVTKTLDPDGDNIYGTAGYLLVGTTPTANNAGGFSHANVGDDLLTWTDTSTHQETNLYSIPSYLNVALAATDNGTFRYYGGYSVYINVDDPTQLTSANVSDVRAGFLWRNTSGSLDLLTLTLGAGFPSSGLRVGVLTDFQTGSDQTPTSITITGPDGSATVNPTPNGTDGIAGDFDGYFFDLTGNAGDVFTISTSSLFANSGAVGFSGLSFDELPVPEPSPLALAGVGGLLLLLGHRFSCIRQHTT